MTRTKAKTIFGGGGFPLIFSFEGLAPISRFDLMPSLIVFPAPPRGTRPGFGGICYWRSERIVSGEMGHPSVKRGTKHEDTEDTETARRLRRRFSAAGWQLKRKPPRTLKTPKKKPQRGKAATKTTEND